MKRLIQMGLAVVICCLGIMVSANRAWGYTEAQKRQAKAWLSAHGYPPTWDGAYQAYDDWLGGKWWDEFGSPDDFFGEDDEEERPTAATQRSQEGKRDTNRRTEDPEPEVGGARNAGGEDAVLYFLGSVLGESDTSPEIRQDLESLLDDLNREVSEQTTESEETAEAETEETEVTEAEAAAAVKETPAPASTEEAPKAATQVAETSAAAVPEEASVSRLPWILGIICILVILLLVAVRADRRKKR